jgi:phosphoglycolate phosphatase
MEGEYSLEECTVDAEYVPTIKNRLTGATTPISTYAKKCVPTGDTYIYARPIKKRIKVFTAWDEEKYMLGVPGDYLAVRCDDMHDLYIVEKNIFGKTYQVKED